MDALLAQTGQSLSKYEGFGRKHICYTGNSKFNNLLQLRTFLRSAGAIQSQVINFQPFQIKFAIFNAFTDLF